MSVGVPYYQSGGGRGSVERERYYRMTLSVQLSLRFLMAGKLLKIWYRDVRLVVVRCGWWRARRGRGRRLALLEALLLVGEGAVAAGVVAARNALVQPYACRGHAHSAAVNTHAVDCRRLTGGLARRRRGAGRAESTRTGGAAAAPGGLGLVGALDVQAARGPRHGAVVAAVGAEAPVRDPLVSGRGGGGRSRVIGARALAIVVETSSCLEPYLCGSGAWRRLSCLHLLYQLHTTACVLHRATCTTPCSVCAHAWRAVPAAGCLMCRPHIRCRLRSCRTSRAGCPRRPTARWHPRQGRGQRCPLAGRTHSCPA